MGQTESQLTQGPGELGPGELGPQAPQTSDWKPNTVLKHTQGLRPGLQRGPTAMSLAGVQPPMSPGAPRGSS